eukprot:ANDGO_00828.mRNA.1 DNA polymerase delta small subunit
MGRTVVNYENLDGDYRVKLRSYTHQYAHVYFYRLNVLRQIVLQRIPSEVKRVSRVLELQSFLSHAHDIAKTDHSIQKGDVAVVGTLYKEMKLKPSVLKPASTVSMKSFCSDEDALILEDESGRVRLSLAEGCNFQVDDLPTGIVTGLCGRPLASGQFLVKQFYFAGIAPQKPLPADIRMDREQFQFVESDPHLLIIESPSPAFLAQITDLVHMMESIVRIVIAGNALAVSPTSTASQVQKSTPVAQHASSKHADESVAELCGSVFVDLMPGRSDPSNHLLPQQPIHPCLLTSSVPFVNSTLQPATNPHRFRIADGVEVCGYSSQITDGLGKVIRAKSGDSTSGESVLDVLAASLSWRHLCPCAPDTLACYPFFDRDPFIVETTPHVLFAAGSSGFATRVLSDGPVQCRLIAVPSLGATGEAVLVNLKTLAAGVIRVEMP